MAGARGGLIGRWLMDKLLLRIERLFVKVLSIRTLLYNVFPVSTRIGPSSMS